jgi:endonuclease/exonuclease/phosphatase family metal-dependent hydrolase
MSEYRIFFSNLGYIRGIDGSLWAHIRHFGRHFYMKSRSRSKVANLLNDVVISVDPYLCCFVEVEDREDFRFVSHPHYSIVQKYGPTLVSRLPFHQLKSNGFFAKEELPFQIHHFANGVKKLIYQVDLPDNISVIFTHFSLNRAVRQRQFDEICTLITRLKKSVILLGDFNIFNGFDELKPLTDLGLILKNKKDRHTFLFHTQKHVLDLCLCSPDIEARVDLSIIEQEFSDHDGLLVRLSQT